MQSRSFYLSRRFFDEEHFPYGFSRSGDFTSSEVIQLEKNGQLFKALSNGMVSDPNEEDQLFLKMIRGEQPVEGGATKAWIKYLKCCNRAPVWLTTRRGAGDEEVIIDDEPDFDVEMDEMDD